MPLWSTDSVAHKVEERKRKARQKQKQKTKNEDFGDTTRIKKKDAPLYLIIKQIQKTILNIFC